MTTFRKVAVACCVTLLLVLTVDAKPAARDAKHRQRHRGERGVRSAGVVVVSGERRDAFVDDEIVDNDGADNGGADDATIPPPNAEPKRKRKKGGGGAKKAKKADSAWFHCADGETPAVAGRKSEMMCSREYPAHTCCSEHNVTLELISSRLAEQIHNVECYKMLMKLRCAHCSPRSWWLFHAPDKMRNPHRRMMPILCPDFCRKFQRACMEEVAGLMVQDYCEYQTTNEEGPCFPDYEIVRGSIDKK